MFYEVYTDKVLGRFDTKEEAIAFCKVQGISLDCIYGQEFMCGKKCKGCPHRFVCHQEEEFWGCGIWEEEMGEDL